MSTRSKRRHSGLGAHGNAARSVIDAIEEQFDDVEFLGVAVVSRPGNNGGDRLCRSPSSPPARADVDVFMVCR